MKQNIINNTNHITSNMLDNYNIIICDTDGAVIINNYNILKNIEIKLNKENINNIQYNTGSCILTSNYSNIDLINEISFIIPLFFVFFLISIFFIKGFLLSKN